MTPSAFRQEVSVHAEHAAFVVAASLLFVLALAAVAVVGEIASALQGLVPS